MEGCWTSIQENTTGNVEEKDDSNDAKFELKPGFYDKMILCKIQKYCYYMREREMSVNSVCERAHSYFQR